MRLSRLWLAVVGIGLLVGCPDTSKISIGSSGTEKIDKKLVGTWKCDDQGFWLRRFVVTAKDKNTLGIQVLEKADDVSDADVEGAEAWVTKIGKQRFVYGRAGDGDYVTMAYAVKGARLTVQDVAVPDAVTSTGGLRDLVAAALKSGDTGDLLSSPVACTRE